MGDEVLKWKAPWGPKKFRQIVEWLVTEINERTPKAGVGINVDQRPDGRQISLKTAAVASPAGGDGESGGGSNIDLYGAYNGAAAVFHLSRTRAPTVPPPP